MAISKAQPMRSAEIELVDTVNGNTSDIAAESLARAQADEALDDKIDSEIEARSHADDVIDSIIGAGFTAENTITENFESLQYDLSVLDTQVSYLVNRLRIGQIESIIVPASDTYSSDVLFEPPFADDATCIVFAQLITSESPSLFALSVSDNSYTGFSYTISNSDTDSHTVSFGYLAVRTSA